MSEAFGRQLKRTEDAIERSRDTNFGLMTTVVGLSASAIGLLMASDKSRLPAWFAVIFEVPILLALAQQWCVRKAREEEVAREGQAMILSAVEAVPELKEDLDFKKSTVAAIKGMVTSGAEVGKWFKLADEICTVVVFSFALASLSAVLWYALKTSCCVPAS